MATDTDRRPPFSDPIDAAQYAALLDRIASLMGATEDSPEEEELARLAAQAEALEDFGSLSCHTIDNDQVGNGTLEPK